ncbi:hypothetical protein EDB19DRAFT_1835946 [Suillus lakei]|nr:hypothetical protein EDB19DRAFT_1835946 [Suillus lakei]
MPLLAENPNHAVLPDFRTEEYAAARAHLISDAVNNDQAAKLLADLWVTQNQADKQCWATRLEEEAQAILEEQEAAITEERKKNKSKYAPVRDADVPSNPVILPCQYAVRKMKAGDYCELFYFTNSGLEEASNSSFTADADTLIMMTSTDGSHKWIPAGAARDPKAQVLKDDNLTWEQFNEAAPRMIISMKENDWPVDRVDMHVAFWSMLQNHHWRHAFNTHKQHALLLYQVQQRCRWHLAIGSSNSWSLARVNQDLLDEAHEEVFKQFRIQQVVIALQTPEQPSSQGYEALMFAISLW